MDIDANLLRWANLTAIQRLARSLGVDTTWTNAETQRAYRKRLIEATAAAIGADKRRAAAEEQRMKDEEARREVAVKIADALGEVGAAGQAPRKRVEAQITRMISVLGAESIQNAASVALAVHGATAYAIAKKGDGSLRSPGGVFFAEARRIAWAWVGRGMLDKRGFHAAFCWHEPKPRALPSKPATKLPIATMESPVEAPPDPYHVMHRTRGGKGPVGRLRSRKAPEPVVEYVATRRRRG